MLKITLKSGVCHEHPVRVPLETILRRIKKEELWTLEFENFLAVYRTSEIAHISVSKENKEK